MSPRFGKKKDDKSKEAAKASKSKLEALSEEELDRVPDSRDGYGSPCCKNTRGFTTRASKFTPSQESICWRSKGLIDTLAGRLWIILMQQPPGPAAHFCVYHTTGS